MKEGIKNWTFPDNLDFKSKIMAKLLVRSRYL